jgi:hypothetical protein
LSTNIVDVSGVSLRQFWNLKSHMQAASQLATAHYPETLDRIFIIGAPYFFSTVWGWIKRWFDPNTVSKIFILSAAEVKPTLESYIDLKNVPSQYGGELTFKSGDRPNLDPYIKQQATWENGFTEFPEGPLYWREVDGGRTVECVAAGSIDKVERVKRVCTLPKAVPTAEKKEEEEEEEEKKAEAVVVVNGEGAAAGLTEADIKAVENMAILEGKKEEATVLSEKVAEVEGGVETKATTTAVSA